jgi:prolyl oligopeptidase
MRKSRFSIATVCALAHAAFLFTTLTRAQTSSPSVLVATDDSDTPKDYYLWLEDTCGEKPLTWVREHNAATVRELEASTDFENLRAALFADADANKNPGATRYGNYLYRLKQDGAHPKGLWQRTTPDTVHKQFQPWETVLDVDALGADEK